MSQMMIAVRETGHCTASMGASGYAILGIEVAVGLVFSGFAVLGFKKSMWLAAAGIAGHGFFDFFIHHAIVTNPGMPVWWPGFCGTIDIVLGGGVAICIWKSGRKPVDSIQASAAGNR